VIRTHDESEVIFSNCTTPDGELLEAKLAEKSRAPASGGNSLDPKRAIAR
jgi:hypothetical protein